MSKFSGFRLFYLAPALALIALTAWSFASPMGSSPDDDFHLASIWCAGGAKPGECKLGTENNNRYVPEALHYAPCFAMRPTESAKCQTEFDLNSNAMVLTDRGSFANNYPPMYYSAMNLFVGSNILASVLVMRIINALLFVGVTWLLYWLLPIERRSTLIWAWLITTVPLGLFLIASNNPSAWALIGVGSAWLALLGYFESSGRRKVALGAIFAATAIMAAGSRGDAGIYVVLSVIAVGILTFRRDKGYFVSAILPLIMSAIAILFFLSSQQSSVVSSGLGSGTGSAAAGQLTGFALIAYNLLSVQSLWTGAFGGAGLGWLDTTMPAIVEVSAVATFVAVAFVGLSRTSWRKTLVVVAAALTLWILPTYVLVKGGNVVPENVQPRYLLPLIVVFAGLAMFSVAKARLKFSRIQVVFIILSLSIAQAVALQINMRRYITGIDKQGWNLDANIEWWWDIPFSPMFVWIVGSVAFAALVTVTVRELTRTHELA
ncbi:MAG TPA: DUF2142 domain-containing protein [Terrimesophilobacter sp.]|nr:DUF2142 domain-containing protein [Terrimesophilobacter sp.]